MSDNKTTESAATIFADEILRGVAPYLSVLKSRLALYVRPRYSASREECDDLVAEIMAVVVQGLQNGQFRGQDVCALNAYVYGIARVKIMKAVEREGRRRELSQHLVSADMPVSRFTDPDVRVVRTELLEQIYACFDERCRELIEWKFIYGWTDQEIADYKKMTRNAVSTAISRCLEKARQFKAVAEILYQEPRSRD